ncbi:MAG: hypothetical protein RLZZ127_637 [Planctomycetota bacterium]|jgi:type II secretory pathway pseudopilin PulG
MRIPARGMTLVELLVATAIGMTLLALTFLVWSGTLGLVERARATLQLDIRSRQAADQVLTALDNRSGVMPMSLQDEASGRLYPFQVMVFLSKSHIDGQGIDNAGSLVVPGSDYGMLTYPSLDLRWVRERDRDQGQWNGWNTAKGTNNEPALDPYAPGQVLKQARVGAGGNRWGIARMEIWHSPVARLDRTYQHLTGQAPAVADRIGYNIIGADGEANLAVNAFDGPIKEWSKNAATRVDVPNNNQAWTGPYRGVAILPTSAARAGAITTDGIGSEGFGVRWAARGYALRALRGPSHPFESWRAGIGPRDAWQVQTGAWGNSGNTDFMVPWWSPDGFPTAPVPADPGVLSGQPLSGPPRAAPAGRGGQGPAYGTVVEDGGVAWRIEAPYLHVMAPGADSLVEAAFMVPDGVTPNDTMMKGTPGAITADTLVVRGSRDNPAHPYLRQQRGFLRDMAMRTPVMANVSTFRITTPRQVPADAFGRAGQGVWNSLTAGARPAGSESASGTWGQPSWYGGSGGSNDPNERTWWQTPWDSNARGYANGFIGSQAGAASPPGHPAWCTVTVGVVGGFTVDGAIERTWTIGAALR